MERMLSSGGKNVIKRRKAKGRKKVTVTGRSKVKSKR